MAKFRGKDVCFSPRLVFVPDESDATATAADIAQGKTAYVDNVKITGTMATPSGNQDIDTLDEYNVTAKATARISAAERAKIIPENIAQGVTILGVTGTHISGAKYYLTFSSESSFTLAVEDGTKHWDGTLYYSTDLDTWTAWDGTTTLSSANGKLYICGLGNTIITGAQYSTDAARRLVITGSNVSCDGDIRCLIDCGKALIGEDPTIGAGAFGYLFYQNLSLVKAPSILFQSLPDYACVNMFEGTGIVNAPVISATDMGQWACNAMFYACPYLIRASSIKATSLQTQSIRYMYANCPELITLPAIHALNFDYSTCQRMFYGCAKIKLSETQTGEYVNEYRIPSLGTGTLIGSNALADMFTNTGGTFAGTPTINTTYYTANEIIS